MTSVPFEIGMCQVTNPQSPTVKTANKAGQLQELSKQISNVNLEKRLFLMLKEQKIGTFKLELQALNLHQEDRKRDRKDKYNRRKKKIQLVIEGRNEGKVLDLIKLKLQYIQREEKELKKEYVKTKKEYEGQTSSKNFKDV